MKQLGLFSTFLALCIPACAGPFQLANGEGYAWTVTVVDQVTPNAETLGVHVGDIFQASASFILRDWTASSVLSEWVTEWSPGVCRNVFELSCFLTVSAQPGSLNPNTYDFLLATLTNDEFDFRWAGVPFWFIIDASGLHGKVSGHFGELEGEFWGHIVTTGGIAPVPEPGTMGMLVFAAIMGTVAARLSRRVVDRWDVGPSHNLRS